MICTHISIKAGRYGQTSTCLNCKQPIIHDGAKWRWQYDLDPRKIRKMRNAYAVNAITKDMP